MRGETVVPPQLRGALLLPLLLTLLVSRSALAAPAANDGASLLNTLVLKGVYASSFASGHQANLGGVGLSYCRELLPHRLVLELGGKALFGSHLTAVPLELLARVPFYGGHGLHLTAGLGPLVEPVFHGGETVWAWGGTATVEALFSVSHRVGLVLEVGYVLKDEHGLVQVVEAMGGVALRF